MSPRLQTEAEASLAPSFTPVRSGLLQRKCACGGTPGPDGECAACRKKRLQRRSTGQARPATAPPIVHEVLNSPGQPLDAATRAFMEPRFGHDFGRVRVHTDARAAESARAVDALAYTVGQDVVFGSGQHSPGTRRGKFLLAHELSHVLQQSGAAPAHPDQVRVGDPHTMHEREADHIAETVTFGQQERIATPAFGGLDVQLQRVGFGEVRVAEARLEEEERIRSGCPVNDKGTLSEVSWGETSGLYPTKDNKFQPDKWDRAKTCELLRARGAVHAVGQRGESVHKDTPNSSDPIEQKLKIYHFTENFLSLDPEIADPGVKWFFLSTKPDEPEVHPGTTGTERVKTYGSFYNIGGGDVPVGDVYLLFYRLKPKPPKTEVPKPNTGTSDTPTTGRDNPSDVIHE